MSLTLFGHQSRGMETLLENPRYYLAWEMGTGKTITTLSAVAQVGGKTLVCCPKSVRRSAWLQDAAHFPTLRAKIIEGSTRIKRAACIAADDWDVGIINYEMFRLCTEELGRAGVRRLVCDEASRAKNYKAKTTQALVILADSCESVWMLSGTPAPNCPSEWIPQMRIVSRGAALGPRYWSSMTRFFYPQSQSLRDGRKIVARYLQTPKQAEEFRAALRPWVWSLKKAECITLPAQTDQVIEVELSSEELTAYLRAKNDLVLLIDSGEPNRIKREAALIKLRQIAGGSVLASGVSQDIGDSKLAALGELLDSIGPEEPVVIWAEFSREIDRIRSMIVDRGESVATIDGRTSHLAGDVVKDFQDGNIKRLVCHPASAGHGITLTAASYTVYYSISFSAEQHQQSRDRIHRIGQSRPCTYVYLLAEDTVDRSMFNVLRRKKSVSDEMAALLGRAVDPESCCTPDTFHTNLETPSPC